MIQQIFHTAFPVLLAPMAGVTDLPYRRLCRELGCDFTYTEMVSAKGLRYGAAATAALLETSPEERPCGVQLFGREPAILAEVAGKLCRENRGELALIDINMGCPAPKITGNGEGSALMKEPKLAAQIIEAVVKASDLPVTVKFRKGFDAAHCNALEFAKLAQESGAALVTLHGRTREQMYSGKADWDVIARVKQALSIPVIGNGDVFSGADALAMRAYTHCDGIMVARGAQGNPFIFQEIQAALAGRPYTPPTPAQRLDMALEHLRRAVEYKGERAYVEMRKHMAWYIRGIRGAPSCGRGSTWPLPLTPWPGCWENSGTPWQPIQGKGKRLRPAGGRRARKARAKQGQGARRPPALALVWRRGALPPADKRRRPPRGTQARGARQRATRSPTILLIRPIHAWRETGWNGPGSGKGFAPRQSPPLLPDARRGRDTVVRPEPRP